MGTDTTDTPMGNTSTVQSKENSTSYKSCINMGDARRESWKVHYLLQQ